MKKYINKSLLSLGLAALVGASAVAQTEGPLRDPLDPISMRRSALQLAGGAPGRSYTGTEFNPAISVIIDSLYSYKSDDLDEAPGFELGGHHHHGHGHGHAHGIQEGFSVREIELSFQASVDPYFDAFAMIAFEDHDVDVEEAYITTRALPGGLQLKAGKFFSDVGYINKQHLHDWLFADAPWMREFFFGDHGLNEIGVQLSWLPPLPTYVRLGVEVLEGETEGVANYVGSGRHQIVTILPENGVPDRNRWRADSGLKDRDGPRLFTAFAKWGTDIAYNHAIQLGTFGGYSRLMQLDEAHSSGRLETWEGDALFAGLDAVYKYNGRGVMGHRNFVLQGEYIYRQLDLDYRSQQFESFSSLVTTDANNQKWKQDGLYVQGVYGFAPRWNAGLRTDIVGIVNDGFEGRGTPVDFGTSYRHSAQLSYAPTEFSRLRAQVNYEDMADGEDAWTLVLQYNMSIGVHGAHAF